jgi:predicted AAA+ superfamily ATPase
MQRKQLSDVLKNLIVFKNLRDDPLICALAEMLGCGEIEGDRAFSLLCNVVRELFPHGNNLANRVFDLMCADDNFYIRGLARGEIFTPEVAGWAKLEIEALQAASEYTTDEIVLIYSIRAPVPKYITQKIDMLQKYLTYAKNAGKNGYGIFADHYVFTVSETGDLVPVENPDQQRLSELYGYEREREKIIENTEALLAGIEANNVLLYGDAGTGKSSTIKAVANEYRNEGLRLIQIEKGFLRFIPSILDSLAPNPLKFIIFIDDLSFRTEDRSFTALKTVLEGSVAARAKNTVVYATSNRRHLVRECFSDREGDDVHLSDTLEETGSLADRFGIVITFTKPDKDGYDNLVIRLARRYGVTDNEADLLAGAEAFAQRRGGRSPRVAKQYIEYKSSKSKNEI